MMSLNATVYLGLFNKTNQDRMVELIKKDLTINEFNGLSLEEAGQLIHS